MSIYAEIFVFWALIAILFLIYIGPWTDYRVDLLRMKLLDIRDDLFWYVYESNGISHSSEAYRTTRTTINGLMRYADELTLSQIVVGYCLDSRKTVQDDYQAKLSAALSTIPQDQKLKIEVVMSKVHAAVIDHIIATSPVLSLLSIPSRLFGTHGQSYLNRAVRIAFDKFRGYVLYIDVFANTAAGQSAAFGRELSAQLDSNGFWAADVTRSP